MSLLIVGKDTEKRKTKALEIAHDKYKSSQFDIVFIEPEDGKSAISIEKIKDLKKNVYLKPFNSPAKTVIIHEFEKTTLEAQNALLKLLEEPPNYTYIILTSSSAKPLLSTILSRCSLLKLDKQEKVDEKYFSEILNNTEELFGITMGQKFEKAEELAKDKQKAIDFLEKVIFVLRQILLAKFNISGQDFSKSNLEKLSIKNLENTIKKTDRAVSTLKTTNSNHRLLLENLLLEFRLN